MAARRRPSMRTRMKVEDVSSWVEHNNQTQPFQPQEQNRVRFVAPSPSSKISSIVGSIISLTEKPVYLDGGYGWYIVFSSCVIHAILDGESFCFGLLYVMIQSEYAVNHFVAMLIASPFLALPLCFAPVAGLVSDLCGCRKAIMIGGAICTISCAISIFCTNVVAFGLFLGFGCGFGMSFIYNAAIVIVTYYFESKRGTATSIAVAGTGCGTFVFPAYITLAKYLLSGYMTPLQAALTAYTFAYAIIVLIGFLLKDVKWKSDSLAYKEKKFEKMMEKAIEDQYETPKVTKQAITRRANSLPNLAVVRVDFGSIQSVCEAKADGKMEVPTRSKSVALFDNNKPSMPPIPEYSMINTTLANLEHLDLELANSPCTTVRAQRRRVTSKISMSVDQINELDEEVFKKSLFHSSSVSESEAESSSEYSEMSNDGDSSSSELSDKKLEEPTAKLLNKPVLAIAARATSSAPTSARLRGSLAPGNYNMSGGRILASNAVQSRWATNLITMGKIPSAPMLVARKKRKTLFHGKSFAAAINVWRSQKPTWNEILHNRSYLFFLASVSCLYATLDVPYVCFFDYGMEHLHLSETLAKSIYSAIGLANVLSTIIYGKFSDWLADNLGAKKYISILYIASMFFVAVTLFTATFVTTGVQLIINGVFFGVFVTGNYVLQSILVGIIFDGDMELFQAAYSAISMMEGIASFVGPIIFSYIRQFTGNYETVFFMSGIMQLLSAFFAFLFYRELMKTVGSEEDDEVLEMENGVVNHHELPENDRPLAIGNGVENESLLHV